MKKLLITTVDANNTFLEKLYTAIELSEIGLKAAVLGQIISMIEANLFVKKLVTEKNNVS